LFGAKLIGVGVSSRLWLPASPTGAWSRN